ncbi:HotDog domain-containing protein [Tricharina praecox]|uniref:HotDog domain-containing protein n=1 Tax=Tricharina praecox TaxID=43433 RepID=UPI00221F9403|nr:HotDog domain-containing protein [Tricharina praecox]KAI5847583.1 HotDog domain-containing protein [Tricharina praecox]
MAKPTVPAPTHPDFASTPWAHALLTLPTTVPITNSIILEPKHTLGREDSLTAVTLQTPSTFRALSLFRILPCDDACLLISLGDGMNGHEGILHGGMVATILDIAVAASVDTLAVTAYINVAFRRPVPTPSVVLCKTKLVRKERRKLFINATLEDGIGGVYSMAESLLIEMRQQAKL